MTPEEEAEERAALAADEAYQAKMGEPATAAATNLTNRGPRGAPQPNDDDVVDLGAMAHGAARWGSGGFDDEIVGALAGARAPRAPITERMPLGLNKAQRQEWSRKATRPIVDPEARQQWRDETEEAYQRSPGSYIAGAVPAAAAAALLTGGGALVAKVAKGAKLLTKIGAGVKTALTTKVAPLAFIQGVGLSDQEGIDALKAGTASTLLSAGISGALPVVGAGLRATGVGVQRALKAMGENADDLRLLTPSSSRAGITRPQILQKANEVPGGRPAAAAELRSSGVSVGVTTAGRIKKLAAAAMEKSEDIIADVIADAGRKGLTTDPKTIAMALRLRAIEIQKAVPSTPGTVDATNAAIVDALIDRAREIEGVGKMTMRDMQTRIAGNTKGVRGLADDAKFGRRAQDLPTTARGDAAAATVHELRAAQLDLADQAGRGAEYTGAKRTWQVNNIADAAAEEALDRAAQHARIGLTDATLAASGKSGVLLAIMRKLAGPLTMSSRATAAEVARELARAPALFSKMGPRGAKLAKAARGGGPALMEAARTFLAEFDDSPAAVSAENAPIDDHLDSHRR